LALETDSKKVGSIAVLSLKGKITLGEGAQILRKAVEDLVDQGSSNIVLDLASVPFVDSAGLGALTVGFARAKAAGGLLKLAGVQSRVRDALEVTRLTRMFPLYESENQAVASFASVTGQ